MKAKEVMEFLGISRMTLYNWCRDVDGEGNPRAPKIRRTRITRKTYEYNDEDVYALKGVELKRDHKVVLYGRVSSQRDRPALQAQMARVREWAGKNGYAIDEAYADVCPGFKWARSERRGFHALLKEVFNRKVDVILVEDKTRLGLGGSYDLLEHMLRYSKTRLVCVTDAPYDEAMRREAGRDMAASIKTVRDSLAIRTS